MSVRIRAHGCLSPSGPFTITPPAPFPPHSPSLDSPTVPLPLASSILPGTLASTREPYPPARGKRGGREPPAAGETVSPALPALGTTSTGRGRTPGPRWSASSTFPRVEGRSTRGTQGTPRGGPPSCFPPSLPSSRTSHFPCLPCLPCLHVPVSRGPPLTSSSAPVPHLPFSAPPTSSSAPPPHLTISRLPHSHFRSRYSLLCPPVNPSFPPSLSPPYPSPLHTPLSLPPTASVPGCG